MIRIDRIFNYLVIRYSIKLQNQRVDRPVLHMDGRQLVEQLDFRKRRVLVAIGACRLLKRVRMDNRRAPLDMDVHKQRNAAVVHHKKCRQQPFHVFHNRLFHTLSSLN